MPKPEFRRLSDETGQGEQGLDGWERPRKGRYERTGAFFRNFLANISFNLNVNVDVASVTSPFFKKSVSSLFEKGM